MGTHLADEYEASRFFVVDRDRFQRKGFQRHVFKMCYRLFTLGHHQRSFPSALMKALLSLAPSHWNGGMQKVFFCLNSFTLTYSSAAIHALRGFVKEHTSFPLYLSLPCQDFLDAT